MTVLYPADLLQFSRQFKFTGGRVKRVRLRTGNGDDPELELILAVRSVTKTLGETPEKVLLRLRCVGVDEFRFQKRPGHPTGKMTDCRFGYFQDLFFINLDAWGLLPGDAPKIHDYRASDAYVACRDLRWEKIERPKSG